MPPITNTGDNHFSCIDADTERERYAVLFRKFGRIRLNGSMHSESCKDGPLRIVLMCRVSPKKRNQSVTAKLIHRATKTVYLCLKRL
jgi:hypothetical protein